MLIKCFCFAISQNPITLRMQRTRHPRVHISCFLQDLRRRLSGRSRWQNDQTFFHSKVSLKISPCF